MEKKRKCHFCQSEQINKKSPFTTGWIVENQFLGNYGKILKEQLVGGGESHQKDREPIKTVYYCSWGCMEEQNDKEEEELWAKGDCPVCKKPLAVINDDCQDLEHKRLGSLLPIKNTPDCLK